MVDPDTYRSTMEAEKVRRRRLWVLAVVLLSAVSFAAYAVLTRTPSSVERAAINAVRSDNPGRDDDKWSATCDKRGGQAYDCVVTWKQVGITPADGLGDDFCEDFAVQVRHARVATPPVRLENDGGVSLRRC